MTILRSVVGITVLAMLQAACAVRLDNESPAQALAGESAPRGSAYAGWRVYDQRCASCHGKDAAGPAPMPDLLDRVARMGPRRFLNLVLVRYDWSQAIAEDEGAAPIPRRYFSEAPDHRGEELEMPAWANQPAVVDHVDDLYAYLSARAEGRLGPGAPPH